MHDLLTFGTLSFTINRYDSLTQDLPAYQYKYQIYLVCPLCLPVTYTIPYQRVDNNEMKI